jgi:hypothetical protein
MGCPTALEGFLIGHLAAKDDNTGMRKRSSKKQPVKAAAIQEQPVEAVAAESSGKNPAAVELGRRGGLKGGKARAAKLTKEQRSEIAKKAAAARWANRKPHSDS